MLRDVRTPAKVEAFSGQVVRRDGAGTGETMVRLGDQVGEGAQIVTGRNSFLTLRLSDGSTVAFPSQSTVRIMRLRRIVLTGTIEREFELQNGRARATVTPMPDANSTFRVLTPITHAAVRGTAFRSAYDAGTGIGVTAVDEGTVAVDANDAPKAQNLLLTRGFGAVADKSSPGVAIALLDAPALVNPGLVQTGPALQFALAPLPGAKAYRIEIARDGGLLDPIAEEVSDLPNFTLASQPSGTYFARVSAIDEHGLEGKARTYAFERRRNSVTGSLLKSGSGRRNSFQFKWNADADGKPMFRFQLRRSDDSAPMVDELGLTDSAITIANLAPGAYAWRVMSIIEADGKIFKTWMPEQTFELAKH